MMIQLNHSKDIKEIPFKRGLIQVQNNSNIAFFNVSRTSERENSVKWVGPLQQETDYFYELKTNPTGIKTLEDAKKVKNICVMLGSIHETILRKNNFTNIHTNHNYIGCFKMLKLGRVDLTPTSGRTGLRTIERAGLSPDKVQQTPVVLLDSEGYLAFSKNIPDKIIKNWQDALDHIKSSGKYQQLYDQYYLSEAEP
jgi:polar amino acid transport system substrate-binding protein